MLCILFATVYRPLSTVDEIVRLVSFLEKKKIEKEIEFYTVSKFWNRTSFLRFISLEYRYYIVIEIAAEEE